MRKMLGIVVAVLVLIAACTPVFTSVEGPQHLTIESRGGTAWASDEDVTAPGYHVGLAADGRLARVAGKAVVRSSNGHQVRVTIDVYRVRARLLGTIELKDLTVPGRLVGLVNQPATAPSEEGSTTQVSLTGRGRTTSGRSLVPASISLTLRVATSQTSDRELVLGRPSRIGALSPGESRSWTLSITRPGSFGLSVGGGESGACPDLEVLDSGGTAIAGLGGCGYTTLVLGAEGTYVFRETAGDSGDMGDSSILVTEPTDAGRLTVGTTVGAPELAPGQYASWKLDGTTGQRIGVAAWSSRAGTSVVLIDPEGNELSSSGATGGDRVAFAELPLTGEYTVQVSNASAITAPAGDVSVRASSPASVGTLPDGGSSPSPELLPGGTAVWTVAGTATSVLTLDVAATGNRCALLRVVAPGNPLPTENRGCGRITQTRVAAEDGDWRIELTNLDVTTAPSAAFAVAARPPTIVTPLDVSSSATLSDLASGGTVQIPVAGGNDQAVTFRINGVDGECYSALVRLNGVPTGAGSGLCDQRTGSIELETVVPTMGDFTLEVSSQGLVTGSGPLTVAALTLRDIDAGGLNLGATSLSPAATPGDRVVWSHELPGAIEQIDFRLGLDAHAAACTYFDTVTAGAPPSPLARLCPGETRSVSRVVQDKVSLRAAAEGPLDAGAISVVASANAGPEGDGQRAAASTLTPSQHNTLVDSSTSKPNSLTRPAVAAALAGTNADSVSQPCKDVLFVGLRGSGQPDGYGPQVWSAYVQFAATLAGRLSIANISIEAPDYKANPVPGINSAISTWNSYFDGINKGADALYNILQTRRGCGETIVLAGYSQGAMAVHRTLIDLAVNQDSETLSRIAGAILIADGDRRFNDRMTTFGTAGTVLQGIAPHWGVGGARPVPFGSSWQNTILSVCNARDIVCDHFSLVTGWGTHKGYTNTQPVWDAAKFAAYRTIALRRLTHGSWPGPNEPISSCLITTTLTWSGPGDVDLHVQEPNGRHVYYGAKQGGAGYLDIDNVTGFGPEHYFASCNSSAARGDFIFGVTNYNAPTSTPIQVHVTSRFLSAGPISVDIGAATQSPNMSFPLFRLRVTRTSSGAINVQRLPV